MPTYNGTGTRVSLLASSLAASIHDHPIWQRNAAATKQKESAHNALAAGQKLKERPVAVNGDGAGIHFLGGLSETMPFYLVHADVNLASPTESSTAAKKPDCGIYSSSPLSSISSTMLHDLREDLQTTTPKSRATTDVAKTKNQNDTKSSPTPAALETPTPTTNRKRSLSIPVLHATPQALTVRLELTKHMMMNQSKFLTAKDLKVEIFINGVFSECVLVGPKGCSTYFYGPTKQVLIFSGTRCDMGVEKPWILVPAGQHADGSPRTTKPAPGSNATPEQRWADIGKSLEQEAGLRKAEAHCKHSVVAKYLQAVADLPAPDGIKDMQKPGGPNFGVIDVVICIGTAKKARLDDKYVKRPTRFKDIPMNMAPEKTGSAGKQAAREVDASELYQGPPQLDGPNDSPFDPDPHPNYLGESSGAPPTATYGETPQFTAHGTQNEGMHFAQYQLQGYPTLNDAFLGHRFAGPEEEQYMYQQGPEISGAQYQFEQSQRGLEMPPSGLPTFTTRSQDDVFGQEYTGNTGQFGLLGQMRGSFDYTTERSFDLATVARNPPMDVVGYSPHLCNTLLPINTNFHQQELMSMPPYGTVHFSPTMQPTFYQQAGVNMDPNQSWTSLAHPIPMQQMSPPSASQSSSFWNRPFIPPTPYHHQQPSYFTGPVSSPLPTTIPLPSSHTPGNTRRQSQLGLLGRSITGSPRPPQRQRTQQQFPDLNERRDSVMQAAAAPKPAPRKPSAHAATPKKPNAAPKASNPKAIVQISTTPKASNSKAVVRGSTTPKVHQHARAIAQPARDPSPSPAVRRPRVNKKLGDADLPSLECTLEQGFVVPELSRDCTVAYARPGPWQQSVAPAPAPVTKRVKKAEGGGAAGVGQAGPPSHVLRQVKADKAAWFTEEEILVGVRFLVA